MPIPGIVASGISGHLTAPSSFYSIATATVTSGGQTSITFSSIPSTYTHLQIRLIGKIGSATGAPSLYFNGVSSGTGYAWHNLRGDGSSAAAYSAVSQPYLTTTVSPSSVYNNSNYTASIIDILDYSNTNKNKTVRILQGVDSNGSGAIELYSGLWASTSAINQIDLYNGYTWQQYTQIALYGVK